MDNGTRPHAPCEPIFRYSWSFEWPAGFVRCWPSVHTTDIGPVHGWFFPGRQWRSYSSGGYNAERLAGSSRGSVRGLWVCGESGVWKNVTSAGKKNGVGTWRTVFACPGGSCMLLGRGEMGSASQRFTMTCGAWGRFRGTVPPFVEGAG